MALARLCFVSALSAGLACGGNGGGDDDDGSQADASRADGSVIFDAAPPDAGLLDAARIDAARIDAAPEVDAGPRQFYWADWISATNGASGTATGTLEPLSGSVSLSYSGEINFSQTDGLGTNDWVPGDPYVNAAPPTRRTGATSSLSSASRRRRTRSPSIRR